MKYLKLYCYNVLVLVSKGVNTFRGGTPHESFSQWVGRKAEENGGFYQGLADYIDWVFFVLLNEADHINDALDGESHSFDVWDFALYNKKRNGKQRNEASGQKSKDNE